MIDSSIITIALFFFLFLVLFVGLLSFTIFVVASFVSIVVIVAPFVVVLVIIAPVVIVVLSSSFIAAPVIIAASVVVTTSVIVLLPRVIGLLVPLSVVLLLIVPFLCYWLADCIPKIFFVVLLSLAKVLLFEQDLFNIVTFKGFICNFFVMRNEIFVSFVS